MFSGKRLIYGCVASKQITSEFDSLQYLAAFWIVAVAQSNTVNADEFKRVTQNPTYILLIADELKNDPDILAALGSNDLSDAEGV